MRVDDNPGYPWRTRPCNLENITTALSTGLSPNEQWTETDLVVPRPRTGCMVAKPDYIPWPHWNTPFHKALKEGRLNAAALLLDRGADINQLNAAGRTAVHEAVQWENSEAIAFLTRHDADLDFPSKKRTARYQDWNIDLVGVEGLLPVHHAIHIGSPKMIQALAECGADIHLPVGIDRWTPLDLALLERRDDIVNVLLRAGARWSSDTTVSAAPSEFDAESDKEDSARKLLAFATSGIYKAGDSGLGHFPPSGCRVIYNHLLSTSGVLQRQSELIENSNLELPSLTLIFFDALFKAANVQVPANVAEDGYSFCSKCLRFQQSRFSASVYPRETHIFNHSPTVDDLAHTAKNGCPLCATLLELLNIYKNRRWSGLPKEHEKYKESPNVLLGCTFEPNSDVRRVDVTKWEDMGRLHVTSGYTGAWLDVVNLRDGLLDSIHTRDDAILGTASLQAMQMARNWIRDCKQNHEACSSGPTRKETPLPTRIIDVGDSHMQPPHIIESNGSSGAFAALSYCWGSSPSLTTTKASLRSHLSELPMDNLPATVRQAIEVTRELGLKYVWIDSLCIVQDDPEDWEREAAQMTQVYSNATITISASTSSGVSEGLFRSRDDSESSLMLQPVRLPLHVPRVLRSYSAHIRHWYVLRASAKDILLKDSPVDKRGWILQEQVLSTRLLHFGKGVLHWACLTSSGSEADPLGLSYDYATFTKPSRDRRYLVHKHDLSRDTMYELWDKWEELVAEYSKRQLSYASDRIPAILSLASTINLASAYSDPKHYRDPPIAGIWRGHEFGVRSLAWRAQTVGVANPCYPSWSWASTTAEIGYFNNHHHYEGRRTLLAEMVGVDMTNTSVSQNYVDGVVRLKGMLGCFNHKDMGDYDPQFRNARKMWTARKVEQPPPLPPTSQDLAAVAPTNTKKMSAKRLRKMERKAIREEVDAMERTKKKVKPGRYYSDRNEESLYNCWFMPVVKFGPPPPMMVGPPGNYVPGCIVCLCFEPVDLSLRKFTRIGICEVQEEDIMESKEEIIAIE